MDKEQLSQLVEKIVWASFSENSELVATGLAKDLDWEDGWERTISKVATNAVTVSARLSVQIILDILIQTGLFKISEEALQPKLTLIRGGADSEPHDQPPQQ